MKEAVECAKLSDAAFMLNRRAPRSYGAVLDVAPANLKTATSHARGDRAQSHYTPRTNRQYTAYAPQTNYVSATAGNTEPARGKPDNR